MFSTNINQQVRHYKEFQFSIFNYKGDLIIKELINNFRVPDSSKVVEIIQL